MWWGGDCQGGPFPGGGGGSVMTMCMQSCMIVIGDRGVQEGGKKEFAPRTKGSRLLNRHFIFLVFEFVEIFPFQGLSDKSIQFGDDWRKNRRSGRLVRQGGGVMAFREEIMSTPEDIKCPCHPPTPTQDITCLPPYELACAHAPSRTSCGHCPFCIFHPTCCTSRGP